MVSILIGVIYFGQNLDQDGVMNMNGAIFMFLTNMTFQNIFAVINVRNSFTFIIVIIINVISSLTSPSFVSLFVFLLCGYSPQCFLLIKVVLCLQHF